MNKYNTYLGQLTSLIGRSEFDSLVKRMEADKYCKGFDAWSQTMVMIFAQITEQNGLRGITQSMNQNSNAFYHLGIHKEIKRATLSYANNNRDCKFFEALYYTMLNKLDRKQRGLYRKHFFAIDATTIGLNMHDFPWARFRSTKSGVKIHVKYDLNNSVPDYLFVTNARKNENTTLSDMKLNEGDTAVFDKGYNNYKTFSQFYQDGILFITRLKSNADFTIVERRECTQEGITSDCIIRFKGTTAKKNCPYELRRIRSVDSETGKSIIVLTNIMDRSAKHIAEMYRKRWQIELFFKAIKQNLKIKTFYGRSENAVKTQIWIAMIVYLLYLLLQMAVKNTEKKFGYFIAELSVCLFHRSGYLLDWFSGILPHAFSPPGCLETKDFQMELGL